MKGRTHVEMAGTARHKDATVKIAELNELIKLKDADVKRLARLNEALVQQCESYMRTLASSDSEEAGSVARLEHRCKEQEDTIARLMKQLQRHNASSTTKDAAIVDDAMRLTQLQSSLLAADNEVKAQIRARIEAEAAVKRAMDDLRSAMRTSAAKDEKLRSLESKADKLSADNHALQQRLDVLRALNEQNAKAMSALESRCQKVEHQAKESNFTTATVATLQRRVHNLTEQLGEARREQEAASIIEARCDTLLADKSDLLKEVAKLNARIAKLEAERVNANPGAIAVGAMVLPASALIAGKGQSAPSTEPRVVPVAQDLVKKREMEWSVERARLEAKLKAIKGQNDGLQEQLERCQSDLSAARQRLAFLEASEVAKTSSSQTTGAEQVKALLTTLAQERAAHERQLMEVESVVRKLADEQNVVEETLKSLQADKETLIAELQAATLERDHLKLALNNFATSRARSLSSSSARDRASDSARRPSVSSTASRQPGK